MLDNYCYYCSKKQDDVYLTNHKDIKDCYKKESSLHMNDRWHRLWCEYIATIICIYSGRGSLSYEMDALRWFRVNILETNEEYINLINLYNVVGPLLAKKLEVSFKDNNDALIYYNSFIKPVICMIIKGKMEEINNNQDIYYRKAVEIYFDMVKELVNKYINTIIIGDKYNELDYGYNYKTR